MTGIGEQWVVYMMPIHGKPVAMGAVCEQAEWDAMELAQPGFRTLVRAGISSETEAESLARDTSGYVGPAPRSNKSRL